MRPTVFHPAAWCAWTIATAAVALTTSNPITLGVALAALTFTAVSLAPERGPYALMLKVGLAAIVIRVVLFGLAGHPGGTMLFTLPEARLPALLGGFVLGGPITAEVLAHSAVEGLRLAVVLVCFGVALSMVEPARILRLAPRFLFEAGLVVAIGVSFVPWLVRTARDVRDAQRLRGVRGPRAAASMAVPVLAATLEHAVGVAETMEARGYGRARDGVAAAESRWRAAALVSVLVCAGGAIALGFGAVPPGVGWPLVAMGAAGTAAACRRLGTLAARTRYARDRLRAHDGALIAASCAIAAAGLMLRRTDVAAFDYNAYPLIAAPVAHTAAVVLAAAFAVPVGIVAVRDARLRRASRPPTHAEAEAPA